MMPYKSNSDLPVGVRRHLPMHAQDIYRMAFNHAWFRYADEGERREAICHRIAWSAVKKQYRKAGTDWVYYESEGPLAAIH